MTKRMALAIAGGLVSALMAAVVALSLGRGIQGASASGTQAAPKPVVKTETQVVTVHKQRPAKAADPQVVTVVRHSSSSSSMDSSSSRSDDDAFENEIEDEHGEDRSPNSGPGSTNSGPGSTNSGHGGEDG